MTQNFGNIVLFGETGSGKSSIINMIADEPLARAGSAANGCTFQHEFHNPIVHGRHVTLVDTAGLNEGDGSHGMVDHATAVAEFYKLMKKLDGEIDLLMLCMRGPRITTSAHMNWKVFYEIICKKKVPIVLIVTHLENEADGMDAWWTNNQGEFERQGLHPDATACITAIRGRQSENGTHIFEEQYKESQAKVRNIIDEQLELHPRRPDKKPTVIYAIIQRLLSFVGIGTREADIRQIVRMCRMSKAEGRKLREELARE